MSEYNMKRRTGIGHIFSNYKCGEDRRIGTNNDVLEVKRVFGYGTHGRGFRISDTNKDKNIDDTLESFEDIRDAIQDNDACLFLAIFTHGVESSLATSEGELFKLLELFDHFSPDNCPLLKGKPKIFIIQACQSAPVPFSQDNYEDEMKYYLPSYPDVLVAFSTLPGFRAHRYSNIQKKQEDKKYGSWFIQTLCLNMKDYNDSLDLTKYLAFVNQKVAEKTCNNKVKKQMSVIVSTLTMKLVLPKKLESSKNNGDDESVENVDTTKSGSSPKSLDKTLGRYEMNSGKAVIFNLKHVSCIERFGTDVDANRLKEVLTKGNFDVEIVDQRTELTSAKIKNKLEIVARNGDQIDCLIIVILTQGVENEKGKIHTEDEFYNVEKLWEPFRADKSPSWAMKPKIFLIQAGGLGVNSFNEDSERIHFGYPEITSSEEKNIPVYADFLFSFAAVNPTRACINAKKGSWYIQSFCDVFELSITSRLNDDRDLITILTRVHKKIAEKVNFHKDKLSFPHGANINQVPCFFSTLRHTLCFPRLKTALL